jgi:signal peptidase I
MAEFLIPLVIIAYLIRTFLLQPFNIPSESNYPTLVVGDFLFVSKIAYSETAHPQRGDMAVFKYPHDTHIDYIKRVIGLPGDQVQMVDGKVKLNGVMLVQEPVRMNAAFYADQYAGANFYREIMPDGRTYIVTDLRADSAADNTMEYTVPSGHYFTLGDNRDNSVDSRFLDRVGYVPEELFVGPVVLRFFSKSALPFSRYPSGLEFANLHRRLVSN